MTIEEAKERILKAVTYPVTGPFRIEIILKRFAASEVKAAMEQVDICDLEFSLDMGMIESEQNNGKNQANKEWRSKRDSVLHSTLKRLGQ